MKKRFALTLLCLLIPMLLCGCKQNPTQEELYRGLFSAFEGAGYSCTLEDVHSDTPVGIYNASVWKALNLGDETVLVYFDESNRADYLETFVDPEAFGYVTRFGQRFVLTYQGTDENVLAVLQAL